MEHLKADARLEFGVARFLVDLEDAVHAVAQIHHHLAGAGRRREPSPMLLPVLMG